jgi:hypothetical protein
MAMTLRPNGYVVLCLASLVGMASSGCKDEEKCSKARSSAADAWKAVTESAGKNKVAPTIGIDELPADKKGDHVQAWGTIEKQAEMISSSFLYEKITWNTAKPALQKTNAAFDGYFAKEKFKSFETQLKDANEKYQATAAACAE